MKIKHLLVILWFFSPFISHWLYPLCWCIGENFIHLYITFVHWAIWITYFTSIPYKDVKKLLNKKIIIRKNNKIQKFNKFNDKMKNIKLQKGFLVNSWDGEIEEVGYTKIKHKNYGVIEDCTLVVNKEGVISELTPEYKYESNHLVVVNTLKEANNLSKKIKQKQIKIYEDAIKSYKNIVKQYKREL